MKIRGGRVTPAQFSNIARWTGRWVHYLGAGRFAIVWSGRAIGEAATRAQDTDEFFGDA